MNEDCDLLNATLLHSILASPISPPTEVLTATASTEKSVCKTFEQCSNPQRVPIEYDSKVRDISNNSNANSESKQGALCELIFETFIINSQSSNGANVSYCLPTFLYSMDTKLTISIEISTKFNLTFETSAKAFLDPIGHAKLTEILVKNFLDTTEKRPIIFFTKNMYRNADSSMIITLSSDDSVLRPCIL